MTNPRTYPDFPELDGLPEAEQDKLWRVAMRSVMRSWQVWVAGLAIILCSFGGQHAAETFTSDPWGLKFGGFLGGIIGGISFNNVVALKTKAALRDLLKEAPNG